MDNPTTEAIVCGILPLGAAAGAAIWLVALRRGAPSWRDAFRRHQIRAFNAAVLVPALAVVSAVAAVELLDPSTRGPLDQVTWIAPLAGLGAFQAVRRPRRGQVR